MRRAVIFFIAALSALGTFEICGASPAASAPRPVRSNFPVQLVDIKSYGVPVFVEMPYATANNFTKQKLYNMNVCLLRRDVADSLIKAQRKFLADGYSLRMLDCYRPRHVSVAMWNFGVEHNKACRKSGRLCKSGGCEPGRADCLWEPLGKFVLRSSRHNLGSTIDATLVRIWKIKTPWNTYFKYAGEVDMGTPYDYFGPKAFTNNAAGEVRRNRTYFKTVLRKYGFRNYMREWWHFDHVTYGRYSPMDADFEELIKKTYKKLN